MPALTIRRNNQVISLNEFKVQKALGSMDGVTITPQMAAFILANHNKHNRPVKDTRVDQYVMEIVMGKFVNNGERILFDWDAELMNGQHRLMACVKANRSIVVDVKFGVDPAFRDSIDTGAVRSTADVRRLVSGNPDSAFIVKAINGVKKILNRRRTGTSPTLSAAMEKDFERGLNAIVPLVKGKNLLGRGPAAGALVLAAEAHPIKVGKMVEEVLAGSASTQGGKRLTAYMLNGFGTDKEDSIASKVLFAVKAHLEENEDFTNLLATTKAHDETVEYFLAAIQRNHSLETLNVIAPNLVEVK